MIKLLLSLSFFYIVIGQPGAPWTEEEALIVKAKLYAIIGTTKHFLFLLGNQIKFWE